MKRMRKALLFILCGLLLSGCGSIQIEVERTPTPDRGSTATVAALQFANRALATQIATLGATTVAPVGPQSSPETVR